MEIEFNTALFDRTKAGLALTAAGEMLYSKALELALLMDETSNLMRSVASETEECIRLGITPTTGITMFPRLYLAFSKLHPEIRFLPVESGDARAQRMLESGNMDAWFTTWSEEFPDAKGRLCMADCFDFARLRSTEMVFCTAAQNPIAGARSVSVADIKHEPLVFLKKPLQRETEIMFRFLNAGYEPNVAFRVSQLAIVTQLVRCGLASSLQLKGVVDDGKEIVGIPLSPPAVYADVLVWNRKSMRKKGFSTFLDYCLSFDF